MDWLGASRHRKRWKYIELRPLCLDERSRTPDLTKSESFSLQTLDLSPSLDTLFHNFHKSCVQRKIYRAEREHLTYEEGRADTFLKKFYDLLLITRRRHRLPPQ